MSELPTPGAYFKVTKTKAYGRNPLNFVVVEAVGVDPQVRYIVGKKSRGKIQKNFHPAKTVIYILTERESRETKREWRRGGTMH